MDNRELSKTIIEKRRKEGWFPVACRLCGEISWFSKPMYRESDFKKGYECYKHRKVSGSEWMLR